MSVPFLIRTSERVLVPSPYDTALAGDQFAELRRALVDLDLSAVNPVLLPATCARFELRGLSPTEVRIASVFAPRMSGSVAQAFKAVSERRALTDVEASLLDVYFAEVGIAYLRMALERVHGVDAWPAEREECLGRQIWPVATLDGLPPATLRWLGLVAWQLTTLTPEKKSLSGSSPDGASGTTGDPTRSATGATSG